jgi:stress-induced morphogen
MLNAACDRAFSCALDNQSQSITYSGVNARERIESKLRERFLPSHLEVHDDSALHAVPRGSETHLRILVVSDLFEARSLLERHRMIYDALGDEMRQTIHALSITSRTLSEWQKSGGTGDAPPCLEGSKRGPKAG